MGKLISGGCLCGDVRYEVADAPDAAYLCHCRNCQKAHAAPYAALIVVQPEQLRMLQGLPARYERTSDSGNMTFREFCSTCGTHLFSGNVSFEQFKAVKIMTFDDPNSIKPDRHVWVESAVEWVCMNDGLPRMAQQQSTDEFVDDLVE